MFANCQMGGMNLGLPDVCKTPSPPSGVLPIPYPNMSQGTTSLGFMPTILWEGTPAHNLATSVPLSAGDNTGVAGGLVSGTDMGPTKPITGSFTVLVGGMPGTKMTSVNLQNSTNAPGASLVPAQLKVLLLAP